MSKIFISYSRDDLATIEKLASALETSGHDVWWDKRIQGGSEYEKDIEIALHSADAVIVAWSPASAASGWVKDEASHGRDEGKLIPICLKDGAAPLGFRQYQVIEFDTWKGDDSAPAYQALIAAIANKTGVDVSTSKRTELETGRAHNKPFIEKARLPALIAAAALGFVTIIAAGMFLLNNNRATPQETAAHSASPNPDEVSIAVLPFADMSPEGNQEYFADGLSEELLNVLARIDKLQVASRTSSFSMKGKDLSMADIADQLNVNHIVEGSIRKSNNRIRVTAQLIDTHTDKHLWSETYDRQLSDIFRIQDEIANSILFALRDELGIEEDKPIRIKPATENLTAYEMYLKARELFLARGKANVQDSLDIFEQIVEMQPDYAEAWEGLSAVYAIATSWGITDRDYSALSLDAAKKALDHDPTLSMPYATIGLTYRTHYPTPWAESLKNLKLAIKNDPTNANAHLWLGMNYMALGYHDEAISSFSRCLDIDDALPLCKKYKSIVYLFQGDIESALTLAEENAEVGHFNDFDVYIPIMLDRGDRLTALTISRFINWWSKFPHADYINALTKPDDLSPERFEALEKWASGRRVDLLDQTNIVLTYRAYDKITVSTFDNDYEDLWLPTFKHFRASPEFKNLARDLGLTDYWLEHGFPAQCEQIGDNDYKCS